MRTDGVLARSHLPLTLTGVAVDELDDSGVCARHVNARTPTCRFQRDVLAPGRREAANASRETDKEGCTQLLCFV